MSHPEDDVGWLQKRTSRYVLIPLICVGSGLLLLLVVFAFRWIPASRAIAAERPLVADGIARIRSERVLRPAFLDPAEEGNSWPHLEQALNHLDTLSEVELSTFRSISMADFGVEPEEEPSAETIAKLGSMLDSLRLALRRRWVEPDYRFEESFALMLPLVSKSLKACRILGDRVRALHGEGRPDEAVELVVLGFGLADHASVKGGVVHQLVRYVENGIMADALKEILSDGRLSASNLARLERTLAAIEEARADLFPAFVLEQVLWRWGVLDFADGAIDAKVIYSEFRRSPLHWYSNRILVAEFLPVRARFHETVEAAVRLPYLERLEAMAGAYEESLKSRNVLVPLIMPDAARCWRRQGLNDLTISMARVAVALARYREARGVFPETLSGLIPEFLPALPVDEVSGQPWAYSVADDAARFYSLGPDRVDDEGEPWVDEDGVGEGDIVWTVKRRK